MKKDNKLVIAIVLAGVLLAGAAMNIQAGSDSAKTAIGYENPKMLYGNVSGPQLMFDPILIHTSCQKDLVVSVTSQNTLVTDTTLKKAIGETDSVSIKVKVVVDENEYNGFVERYPVPNEVVFASRIQEIKGKLSDAVYECTPGTIPSAENCSWNYDEAEWVQLILNTTSANGFNFVIQDLGAGDHEIRVYATIATDTGDTPVPAIAGLIGPRTCVVNEVRLA